MLTRTISNGLREINTELSDAKFPAPLEYAVSTLLTEIAATLDLYILSDDKNTLTRHVIMSLFDFFQRWDLYLNGPDCRFEHKATWILHTMLLRFGKGIVKHVRIWSIDRLK